MTNSTPLYFGPTGECFGILQHPRSQTHQGGILMCPALYAESTKAHWASRKLSQRLASLGYWVLRFDYRGMGNSWGAPAQIKLADWFDDLKHAYDLLVSHVDAGNVSVMATRFSCHLVSEFTFKEQFDKAVFWDPVLTPKDWLMALSNWREIQHREFGITFQTAEYHAQILSDELLKNLQEDSGSYRGVNSTSAVAIIGANQQTRIKLSDYGIRTRCVTDLYDWNQIHLHPFYVHHIVDLLAEELG